MKKQFLSKAIVSSILFCSGVLFTNAQPMCIKKQCTLGGSGDEIHGANIISTGGSSFVTCGTTNSADRDFNVSGNHGNDGFVAKYNSIGQLAWAKTFGGSGDDDGLYYIIQTSDGGYIAVGWTNSNDGDVLGNHGGYDIWVVKLSSSGNMQWQKCFGGSGDDYGTTALQTSNGKLVIAGITSSTDGQVTYNHGDFDIWILKLSSSGSLLSERSYGGSGYDEVNGIFQNQSNNIFFSGETYSNDGDVSGNHGDKDAWVVKLNPSGNIVWQRALGGSAEESGYGSAFTRDGNFVAGCFSFSTDGDVNGTGLLVSWFAKLNPSTGNIIWSRTHSQPVERGAFGLFATDDGGMVEVGAAGAAGVFETWDVLVSKWDVNGDEEWYKTFGGSNEDDAWSGFETSNGNLTIMAASASTDGDVQNLHGGLDIWLLKLDNCGNHRDAEIVDNNVSSLLTYPNPFPNTTTISFTLSQSQNVALKIFDMNGKLVSTLADKVFEAGENELTWDAEKVNAGVYFLQFQSEENVQTQKLIVTK